MGYQMVKLHDHPTVTSFDSTLACDS